ncbi:class I SAM-dependent methyltransferase [Candidatus Pelagibacter sp.]|nr:class I SAM-dependent methyltransferase [Candidatus Pelagibacter sp.]
MLRFDNTNRSKNKKLLIAVSNFIRKIFGGDRIKRISEIIIDLSKKISLRNKKKIIILDFGCGSMEISKKLEKYSFVNKIIGTDTFDFKFKTKKMKYIQTHKLYKSKNNKFDLVIIVDVLHHMGVDDAYKILKKLSKISKNIIVKDHFEYGFFSRHLLRFVDFYANYAYDVNIPNKYFDYKSWKKTVKKSSLNEIKFIKNFQQHDGLFNFILNKKHHFISLLTNDKK